MTGEVTRNLILLLWVAFWWRKIVKYSWTRGRIARINRACQHPEGGDRGQPTAS